MQLMGHYDLDEPTGGKPFMMNDIHPLPKNQLNNLRVLLCMAFLRHTPDNPNALHLLLNKR